jgi:hypothetical protein
MPEAFPFFSCHLHLRGAQNTGRGLTRRISPCYKAGPGNKTKNLLCRRPSKPFLSNITENAKGDGSE